MLSQHGKLGSAWVEVLLIIGGKPDFLISHSILCYWYSGLTIKQWCGKQYRKKRLKKESNFFLSALSHQH